LEVISLKNAYRVNFISIPLGAIGSRSKKPKNNYNSISIPLGAIGRSTGATRRRG